MAVVIQLPTMPQRLQVHQRDPGRLGSVTVLGFADVTQGAIINGFEGVLGTITFNVQDSANAVVATAADLNLADIVTIGSTGDNDLVVNEANAFIAWKIITMPAVIQLPTMQRRWQVHQWTFLVMRTRS